MGERVRRSSCEVVLLNQLKAHTSRSSDSTPNLHIQILLVDDEPTCLSIVAKLLKQCSPSEDETMKLRVTITASPHEALKALREKENTFDIVIMNLHMHEVNGTVFQKQVVRELHVPVIVMSADEDENLMLKTLEDGAILYLLKPIHKEDLKHVWQYAITTKKKGKSVIVEEEEQNNLDRRDTIAITTKKRGEPDIVHEEANNLDGHGTKPAEPSVLKNGASNVSKVEEQKSRDKKVEVDDSKRGRDDGGDDDEDDIELHLGRRAKRKPKVVWTSTLHTRFLMAINHLGNDKAVPKRILQLMGVPGLTRENIASHLQKYRQFVKRVAETNKVPSILSQRRVQSNFASDLSIFQRRTTLEDFEMMRQKRLNPLHESTYKIGSSFINLTQHNQPFLSQTRESSNFQTHLLHSGTTSQGSLANSSLGFGNVMGLMQNRQPMHLPRFGDNSTFCNNLATSQFGAYSNYNRISDTSPIENQLRLMYSTAYSQKLNFNTHTNNMRLNGTSYDVSGATTNPSLDRSSTVGLLPNIGFNGETIGLRNWVSNGYVNVAPTLTRINGSLGFGSASSSQLPSLSTNPPFTSPLNNQLSSPFCQQLNLLGSSNGRGGFENHVDVSNIMSTDHHLLHGIKEGGILLQSNCSIAAPASNINQQQNGITAELGFSGDNSNFSDVEMNNLVAQLPEYPSFSDELSPHTVQTTNIEELLDASDHVQAVPMDVNSTIFDGVSNVQTGFNPVNDKQQEDGVAEFTNSTEMNNLATQLPSSDFSDELLYNTDLTIDIDMLLDASDKVEGVQEQANPTNFDDLVHEFNPVDDKRASPNEGSEEGTADLSPTNSFLAEIESMMEDKDWTDQFIGPLCENDVWTSF